MNAITQSITVLLGLGLLWEIVVVLFDLPSYILPSPWQVLMAWRDNRGIISMEMIPTIVETLIGLFFGVALGSIAAITMSYFKPLKWWLFPLFVSSQVIPTFAIAPLFVIWFGYGLLSKIAVTILMLFFPITSTFFDGLQQTNTAWLDLAKTMHGKKWRIYLHIRIPAALPSVASGLRVASVIAPIGAVIGEWVGSSQGLGYLILNANARMQIDLMFAAIFTLMLFSLLLYVTIDQTTQQLLKWKRRC